MKHLSFLFFITILLLTGCGGSSSSGSSEPDNTDTETPSTQEETQNETQPTDQNATWYQPALSATWQWQLEGTVNETYDVDLYDIDLFDSSAALIARLQQEGKKVICYFSAGSYEGWREDAGDFAPSDLGDPMEGWEEEKWLDIRSENVKSVMKARLDLAARKGCDGVEPDNVDGYANDNGVGLSAADQLEYNRFLAEAAHERGLSIGLKNDLDQIPELVTYFDFAVNEECHPYEECDALSPFTEAGKPVFNAEYEERYVTDPEAFAALCKKSQDANIRTLVLPLDLDDSYRYGCDE